MENLKNEEGSTAKKSNFVPSYKKQDKNVENNGKVKNKNKKIKSKFTLLIIAIIVILLILLVIFLVKKFTKVEYGKYDKLMEDYGLSNLYDNQSANPKEKVTKSEALKVILGATYNIEDITTKMPDNLLYETNATSVGSYSDYVSNDDGSIDFDKIIEYEKKLESSKVEITEAYQDEYWVRYANSISFFNGSEEITDKNYNNTISYIDAIRYLGYAKSSILEKTLDTSFEPNFSDYAKYTNEEKMAIADMTYNQILEDSSKKLNANKQLTKSLLNELIVNYVLKYNLITINDEKININEEKMPSNKDDYPYTLSSINKSVYEIEMYQKNDEAKTPKEMFSTLKEYYQKINTEVEEYYNAVLNVNYETIDNQDFYYAVSNFYTDNETLEKYIKYVKDNKIRVEGTAKVQNPIIYSDGENYRVRVKLEYEVKEASTLKNLLYGDTDSSYKLSKETTYIDLPIFINVSYNEISIKAIPIADMIAGKISE